MTLTEVFDRLHGRHVTRIDFNDGSFVVAPAGSSMFVHFCHENVNTDACVGVSEEGLTLHFNARLRGSNDDGALHGQEEPLSNVRYVALNNVTRVIPSEYHRLLNDVKTFLAEVQNKSANYISQREEDGRRLIERYERLRAAGDVPTTEDELTELIRREMPWFP
jgi:hypothetical protein